MKYKAMALSCSPSAGSHDAPGRGHSLPPGAHITGLVRWLGWRRECAGRDRWQWVALTPDTTEEQARRFADALGCVVMAGHGGRIAEHGMTTDWQVFATVGEAREYLTTTFTPYEHDPFNPDECGEVVWRALDCKASWQEKSQEQQNDQTQTWPDPVRRRYQVVAGWADTVQSGD